MKILRFNNIGKCMSLLLVALILQSCYTKSLDLFPEDQLSDAFYWKSANDFKRAANAFYYDLQGWRPTDENSDIETPTANQNTISNGSYIASENNDNWDQCYNHLRSYNYLIQKAENYEGKDKSEVNVYLGEAKFFRAYANFSLLKEFGGVPLILTPLDVNSAELHKSRASRDEVVDQILNDLNDAITQLPLESDISDTEKGRISKQGAEGFKARVALYEGTWQKFRNNNSRASSLLSSAAIAAGNVINTNTYSLFYALGDSSYRYMFFIDDNLISKSNALGLNKSAVHEYVIKRKYSYALNIRHFTTHTLLQYSCPTKKMADMYLCKDGLPIDKSPLFMGRAKIGSEYLNRELRMQMSFRVPGKRHYAYGSFGRNFDDPKNPGEGIGIHVPNWGENTSTGYSNLKFIAEKRGIEAGDEEQDYPVLRYAEVLLIYAEAIYERDGKISDADLNKSINIVRNRVQLPPLTNAFVNSNGLDMRTEIRRERTVEFFLEGFRLDDLKRWKTAEIEMPQALLGVKFAGTEYETDPFYANLSLANRINQDGFYIWGPAADRKFEQKHYLEPLPTKQVQMMGLEQNPGW